MHFSDRLSMNVICKGRVFFNSSNKISHHSFQDLFLLIFFCNSCNPFNLIFLEYHRLVFFLHKWIFFADEIYDTKLWLIHDVRRENSLSPFPFKFPYDFGLIHKLCVSPFFSCSSCARNLWIKLDLSRPSSTLPSPFTFHREFIDFNVIYPSFLNLPSLMESKAEVF